MYISCDCMSFHHMSNKRRSPPNVQRMFHAAQGLMTCLNIVEMPKKSSKEACAASCSCLRKEFKTEYGRILSLGYPYWKRPFWYAEGEPLVYVPAHIIVDVAYAYNSQWLMIWSVDLEWTPIMYRTHIFTTQLPWLGLWTSNNQKYFSLWPFWGVKIS